MPAGPPLLPDVPDRAAYTRLHGDPAPWLPAIEAICERHGLAPQSAYCERTGTNVVFRVAGGPWIKLFPPLWGEDFTRERTGLAAARDLEGAALPRLLAEGELEGWPYLLLSHLPGRPIGSVWPQLPRAARVALAREIGALLRRLHATPTSDCEPIREDWPAYVRGLIADGLARQMGYGLEPAWAADLEVFLADLPALDTGPQVFLHADVTDDHVFVDEIDGRWRITGLIDFGDAMLGDPQYEFAAPLVFLTQGHPEAQRALLEGYGFAREAITPQLGRRLVAWCLLHRWARIPTYARLAPGAPLANLAGLVESIWSLR